jgi:hypothetical protein
MTGILYLIRLPPLSHDANLRVFGVYGMATGMPPTAKMALYADDGSGNAPTGKALATVLDHLGLPASEGRAEQTTSSVPPMLTSGTRYWLGIVVASSASIAGASDQSGVGKTYPQPYDSDFPAFSHESFADNSMIDLGLYINVQDIN